MKGPEKRWDVLVKLINSNKFESFVEIGVKEGRTTHRVLQKTGCKVYACDPWEAQLDNADLECGETYKDWRFHNIKREFWERVKTWKNRLEFYQEYSYDFAPRLEDESIDLIFIDAAHDYDAVKRDLELFWPKVKTGGILSGHDWQSSFPTVIRAVSERFGEPNLESDSVWWVRK